MNYYLITRTRDLSLIGHDDVEVAAAAFENSSLSKRSRGEREREQRIKLDWTKPVASSFGIKVDRDPSRFRTMQFNSVFSVPENRLDVFSSGRERLRDPSYRPTCVTSRHSSEQRSLRRK